jgi:hypothetical protein
MSVASSPEQNAEPVIVMLKPDAWERGVEQDILARLDACGYVEDARVVAQLDAETVRTMFLHPLPDYVAHLTSRPVSLHLLHGAGGPVGMYACKQAIRSALGVPGRTRNLIHATDEGTEYHMFLSRFFPDAAPERYCGIADADLRFPPDSRLEEVVRTLERLDAGSSLRRLTIALGPGNEALASLHRLPLRNLRLGFAAVVAPADAPDGCRVLAHARPGEDPASLLASTMRRPSLAALAEGGRAITLADFPIPADALQAYAQALRTDGLEIDAFLHGHPLMDLVRDLRARGVTRMNVYGPRMSLMETELRGDLARLAGMHPSGGSSGLAEPGTFSVSRHCLGGLEPDDRAIVDVLH